MAGPRLAKKAFSAAVAIVVSTGFLSITQVPLAGPVAASATSTTFNLAGCTGAQQYAVPGDVSVVKIVAGGGGGETAHTPTGNVHGGGVGGQPGFVTATLPVTPGQTLYVGSAAGGLGGPTGLTNYSGGDGGASAYVTTDASATCGRVSVGSVLVAAAGGGGGGGGGSTGPGGTGGAGGLPYGGDGNGGGGGGRDGGSQTAGAGGFGATDSGPGAGGAAGHSGCGSATLHATDGTSGIGMVGGDGGLECQMTARSGGGGGAGFYGGGGGGGTADNGAGGGGGGYSYAAPNAKFISYPSTGTQLSVTITPVTVSMAAHVEGGSPRATVTSVPYGTVVHLITTLSASAAGVPLNGQTRYRCPSGCRITELGLGFTEINDDGSYGDDKAINTSSLGIGLHHLTVNWSDTSGLFPNQLVGFDLNVEPPPPVVTTDPADSSVTYGGSTTFTAAASVPAGDAPTVEWQTSGDNGAHWAYVGGDDLSTTLTVTPQDDAFGTSTLAVPDFNGRLYRALFTANGLSVASTSAKLTVQPAPLTIRPVDQTYRMGTTPPALTATYDGFVTIGGVTDTSANLAGTLACTSPGTASGATYGTYTITCSGQSSSDYTISYPTGTLTVQAPLPVCQDLDVQTAQGAAVPVQLACTSAITEPLTPTIVAGPSHGSLGAVSSSGAVTYTPAAGYAGNDSFTYHVLGIGGPSLTKTVSIAVAGPPHVTITSPADGGVYERGTPLTAGYTCAPGDFGGVLASSGGCVAAVANGGTIDTATTGVKTFTVVASDNAATPNTTTRTVTYTVHDTIPPDTAIDSGPAASSVIKQTGATFTYHGTAGDTASFECQLDGAAFAPCSSAGATYASLSDGVHTFSVRAVDASGNKDATPATRTWTVDTTPPTIAVVAPLANASYVVGQNLLANFSCNDGPTGSGVASCVGTVANGGVVSTSDPGAKSFVVTASDNLGNTTSQTVTYAVTKATTSTGLTSSLHPSVSGQSVTYTATVAVVAPGSGAPTGTVAFRDAGNPMAGCSAVTVGVAGTAVCTVTYAGPGSHLISASYSGSTRYLASAGTWSQTVNKAPTVVTATNHVRTLLGFAFSATLKRGFDGAPLAGRVITFKVGGTTFCSGVTDSTGRAGCRVIGLVIGSSTYTAGFAGDAAYLPGTGTGLL